MARSRHLRVVRTGVALALLLIWAHSGLRAEPDDETLGKALGYPFGENPAQSYQERYRVGSWSAMDRVPGMRSRRVARADAARPLLSAVAAPMIRYQYRGSTFSVDDYLERRRLTGLLILKNGEIVVERYRYGRTADARFLSFSMAKSVISLLIGIAADKGLIASLDDKAETYAKAFVGSPYGGTTIRHLLRMSSGLTFSERYDGQDDVTRLTQAAHTGEPPIVDLLRNISARSAPEGEKFAYASSETEVLGRVLTGATGRTVSDLTSEWLWRPLGAEYDAFWLLAHDGQERAYAYFNASLRDWGRLGALLARDGRAGDRQLIPRDYLIEATDAQRQPPAFRPLKATPYFGYGYQFWLLPLSERTFALVGLHGQAIYVQPSSGIVMVQTAVNEHPSLNPDPEPYLEREAFWYGVLQSLGGSTADSGTASGPAAPPGFVASPEVYKVIAENDRYRVVAVTFRPNQRDQFHSHPMAAIYYITDCSVRAFTPDGASGSANITAGTVRIQDPVTAHSVENMGTSECKVLMFETK